MTATTTGTTAGAREHARAQEAAAAGTVPTMPVRPARDWPTTPSEVDPATLVHAEVVAGRRLHAPRRRAWDAPPPDRPRRRRLRPRAGLPAGPTVGAAERRGHRQGPVAGLPDRRPPAAERPGPRAREHRRGHVRPTRTRSTAPRRGRGTRSATATAAPQGPTPAGRELFALAAAKHDLARRDLPPSISFFQGVRIDDEGRPVFEGSAGPGASLTLRAEVPLLLLVANTAHPLDPRDVRQHAARGARLARGADGGRRTRSGPPRPRDAAPSSTRSPTSPHGGSHDATLLDDRRPRPRALVRGRARRARSSPSSTSAATRPSTSWSTTPPTPPALQRPRHHPGRRTRCSSPPARSCATASTAR